MCYSYIRYLSFFQTGSDTGILFMTEKNVKRRADILRLIAGGIDGSKGHDTNDKYIVF
ncbi:hypothetical protein B4144_0745 [Bacillus atrophaeus]|nr:hypothetical protein B4144_0745 [Bacillus atrophaeus]